LALHPCLPAGGTRKNRAALADRTREFRRLCAMRRDGQTLRIVDVQTLADNKGKLMNVAFEQLRRNGDRQARQREVYDNGNSAVILPYDPERKTVLLARQLRLPIFLQDGIEKSLEACAGKLDGEEAEPRIKKEIEEELGYRVAEVERLFELYVSPATVMEKIVFFTCRYSPADKVSPGGGLAEEGEDIEVVEMALDEAAARVAAGEIIDAKSVILISYVRGRARA
jgi:GDP-mannose pyrophosphatase NudK